MRAITTLRAGMTWFKPHSGFLLNLAVVSEPSTLEGETNEQPIIIFHGLHFRLLSLASWVLIAVFCGTAMSTYPNTTLDLHCYCEETEHRRAGCTWKCSPSSNISQGSEA